MRNLVALTVFLLACGPSSVEPSQPSTPAAKVDAGRKAKAPTKRADEPVVPASDVPDVVLAVLDTVRADHTSLCGYKRPTTPFLAKLVRDFGASHTCEGTSPASWTLPTHATFFTGDLVTEHHYDSVSVPDWSQRKTLAEQMAAKGYVTVLVTANPVLTKSRGLTQGFQHVRTAHEIDAWRDDDVPTELRAAMAAIDPTKPMFLVVNIMDAHDPYPRIPNDVGWVPARKRLDFKVKDRDSGHPYHQYLQRKMTPAEERAFLAEVTDGYDYGVSRADAALKGVLGVLARRGRVKHGLRLVVTSDHGEFLGEHHLLRHGGWLWQPVVNVPLLVIDTREGHAPPPIPAGPFSTAHVFDLLRDGTLPTPLRDAVAFSSRSNLAENPGSNSVALWGHEHRKLVWTADASSLYDLSLDPTETQPLASDDPSLTTRIAPYVAGYRAQVTWRESQKASAEDLEALKALGYVEQAEP